jgi:hypothetical protein
MESNRLNIFKQLTAMPEFLKLLLRSTPSEKVETPKRIFPTDPEEMRYRYKRIAGRSSPMRQRETETLSEFAGDLPFLLKTAGLATEDVNQKEVLRRVLEDRYHQIRNTSKDVREKQFGDITNLLKLPDRSYEKYKQVLSKDMKKTINEWNRKKKAWNLDPEKTYQYSTEGPITAEKYFLRILDWVYLQMKGGKKFTEIQPPEDWPGIYKDNLKSWQFILPNIHLENNELVTE